MRCFEGKLLTGKSSLPVALQNSFSLSLSLSLSLVSACGSCQERCLRTSRRSIIQHSHEAKSKEKKTNGHGSQGRGLERGCRGMHGKQCALLPRTNLHQRYIHTHTYTHTHFPVFREGSHVSTGVSNGERGAELVEAGVIMLSNVPSSNEPPLRPFRMKLNILSRRWNSSVPSSYCGVEVPTDLTAESFHLHRRMKKQKKNREDNSRRGGSIAADIIFLRGIIPNRSCRTGCWRVKITYVPGILGYRDGIETYEFFLSSVSVVRLFATRFSIGERL